MNRIVSGLGSRGRTTLAALATLALLMGVTGCDSGEDAEMPDVQSRQLDVALSDIERAGFSDEVEIVGGGMFGVVDESNWQVCEQEPAAGEPIGSAPRLTVDRSCEDADDSDAEAEETDGEDVQPEEEGNGDDAESQQVADAPKDDKPKKKQQQGGADTFTMPALVGFNLQDAQDVLQSLGSFLLTQTDATGQGRFQVLDSGWKVCYQNPQPGAATSFLKLVELGAVKLEEQCP
jgi:hypothetical protein